MKARLRVRAARLASRPATTTLPLGNEVPYAIPRRTAITGVIPTLTIPDTPRAPKSPRDALFSRITLCVTMAPASTALEG